MTWDNLIARLNIEGTLDPCPRASIDALQSALHFRLPSQYREFCELLGPGLIAEQIRIFCPGNRYQEAEFRSQVTRNNALSSVDEEIDFAIQRRDVDAVGKYVSLKELLMHSFIFGHTLNASFFLWDLSSASPSDDDYDILLVAGLFDGGFDSSGGALSVGRGFRFFIQDFCFAREHFDREIPHRSDRNLVEESQFRRFRAMSK